MYYVDESTFSPPDLPHMMCVIQGILKTGIVPQECVDSLKNGLPDPQDSQWIRCKKWLDDNVETIKEKANELAPGCGITGNYRHTRIISNLLCL